MDEMEKHMHSMKPGLTQLHRCETGPWSGSPGRRRQEKTNEWESQRSLKRRVH